MTAAEAHQQELEHQQWSQELEELKLAMRKNHGKFVGIARSIRDNNDDTAIEVALEYMAEALEEYKQLEEKMYAHTRLA